LEGDQPILLAAGFSICGVSAIGAMSAARGSDQKDAATPTALVTLFGTAAILVLPALAPLLGLDPTEFGRWVGASVHDVGQVVATASTAGSVALSAAGVVKLTRVLLLAPLVGAVSLASKRPGRLPVPLFVVAFLVAIALRSSGVVPDGALDTLHSAQTIVLTAALFGIGVTTRLSRLRRLGPRPLALGALAWLLVAGVAYLGVRL
jgi:uncharacterized integral membrane protein (TIGR00698 family)